MAGTLAAPALCLLLRRRAARGKEIVTRLGERRGVSRTPRPPGRLLWLHAASVGETVSILPVLAALARRAPMLTLLLTTGTVTSAELLALRLPALGLQGRVLHQFVPLDVPAWVARFLDHWRPDAACFVESELWPNLLAAAARRGVRLMLVNARMSARTLAGWRRVPRSAAHVLGAFEQVQARSAAEAERLRALGARGVSAPGDLKFAAPALPCDGVELARLRAQLAGRPVWLAASTHPGEDPLLLQAHRALSIRHAGLLTIIVPRHPARGAAIAALAPDLAMARRGAGEDPPAGGVWIADTLGELGLLYRLAGITLVGRSLLPPGGGQNPLEPARLGCAIATGPHVGNFETAVAVLEAAGGLVRVDGVASLVDWLDTMLRDPQRRAAMASAAATVAGRDADLPERTADALLALLGPG